MTLQPLKSYLFVRSLDLPLILHLCYYLATFMLTPFLYCGLMEFYPQITPQLHLNLIFIKFLNLLGSLCCRRLLNSLQMSKYASCIRLYYTRRVLLTTFCISDDMTPIQCVTVHFFNFFRPPNPIEYVGTYLLKNKHLYEQQ